MPSQPRRRRIKVETVNGETVIQFADPILDEQNSGVLSQQVLELVDKAAPQPLLLDFRGVQFLSSAALGSLLKLHKQIMAIGGQISFRNFAPDISQVLEATGLDKILDIRPSMPG
jgi:anti-sigma B factor antagonist